MFFKHWASCFKTRIPILALLLAMEPWKVQGTRLHLLLLMGWVLVGKAKMKSMKGFRVISVRHPVDLEFWMEKHSFLDSIGTMNPSQKLSFLQYLVSFQGPPSAREDGHHHGLILKQTGDKLPLVPFFLKYGRLCSSISPHISKIAFSCGVKVSKHGEKNIGLRSRLKLD